MGNMEIFTGHKIDVEGCPHDYFYITPVPAQPKGMLYTINRCGYAARTSQNFRVDRSNSYQYNVLHCVMGGSGELTYRNSNYKLEHGSFFLLDAHEPHCYFADPEDPMELLWIEFLGGDSDRLVQHIVDMLGPVNGDDIFTEVARQCAQIVLNPERSAAEISRDIHGMLATICDHCATIQESRTPLLRKVLTYLEKHLGEKLTLHEVAQVFGYHPSYFSDQFSKAIGRTFSQYVHQRKINHACYLLMTTNWPVDRIGQELGFYDVSHFARRFKTVTGVSPSRYRKEGK